jgi:MFS family permease
METPPPLEAGKIRNPFASPRFIRWWLASMVAGMGVGIQAVTVPLFIRDRVDLDLRALAIAGALVAQTLPGALLALVGGTLADRIERRRILARTFSVAAAVSVAYVVASAFDVRTVWPVYFFAAVVGAAGAFTNPARQSMLPQLVTRTQIQNGVIFGTMGFMAMLQFLGPMVGGVVADEQGLTAAFALEVVLLALAAALFGGIPTERPTPSGRSVIGDLTDGLRYVAREPTIRGLLVLATTPGIFFIGPFSVTVALIVPDVFARSDKWVGILWGCFGCGVVAGSILLTLRSLPRRGLATILSNVAGGLCLTLYGSTDRLAVAAVLLVVWGLCASIFINFVVALLQEHAEPRMLGRVMSTYSLVFFAAGPIGYAQAGLLTTRFGLQPTLVANGVAAAIVGVVSGLTLRAVRTLR